MSTRGKLASLDERFEDLERRVAALESGKKSKPAKADKPARRSSKKKISRDGDG